MSPVRMISLSSNVFATHRTHCDLTPRTTGGRFKFPLFYRVLIVLQIGLHQHVGAFDLDDLHAARRDGLQHRVFILERFFFCIGVLPDVIVAMLRVALLQVRVRPGRGGPGVVTAVVDSALMLL